MKAFLILEDGHVFKGTSIGSTRDVISEIVFNTSMTGYLEVMTDPSYAGQAVCMTYPLIGNYGICYDDQESSKPWVDGFIVRELSRVPSNFRSVDTIQHFLTKHDIPGIAGIDTRALTKILREKGTMNGMITVNENYDLDTIIPQLKAYTTGKVVEKVTCREKEILKGDGPKVALLDLGAKRNIARSLNERGCEVTIYPALTPAEEILETNPDGIMLSNGPGDPKECTSIIKEIKKLYDSEVPIFAICLGHQLMALATGGDTHKMKYGHRGGNHPVKDLATGQVRYSSAAYAGMTAVAVGKLGEIKEMTASEKQLFGGEVLAAPIASDIYSDYKSDLDAKFFKVLTQDVNQFYSYGQKVDINNTSKYNPYYAPCEDYGFLKPAQDKEIIEGSLYYFPSRDQDVKDYVALYLGFTEAELQETYGNKPHVLKKYGLIKEIIERLQ